VTKSSRRKKRGDTTGQGNAFASLLEPAGAKFFEENAEAHKKRKNRRREKGESVRELTPLMEIRTEREFPPRLEKASLTFGFFTVPTRPTTGHLPVHDLEK
jgi:hypothetical protein